MPVVLKEFKLLIKGMGEGDVGLVLKKVQSLQRRNVCSFGLVVGIGLESPCRSKKCSLPGVSCSQLLSVDSCENSHLEAN